ncbi:hypothetical protein LUW74_07785 [Actinomadura madurae]|uniref:hypothetical protein n=1 Tax=Actinomadura madurae TaxID=1993 RepID=UPI002026A0BF|nr:hypothetical protein [Actinomadura madurae]URN10911.1 hypothetical protein LUW74_07785 [Actinomadura madurae]
MLAAEERPKQPFLGGRAVRMNGGGGHAQSDEIAVAPVGAAGLPESGVDHRLKARSQSQAAEAGVEVNHRQSRVETGLTKPAVVCSAHRIRPQKIVDPLVECFW